MSKSLYGDATSVRPPDHAMVVVGKDLFGAEPFDPFTCGAADFPPDIQSKLDEMQVSPHPSVPSALRIPEAQRGCSLSGALLVTTGRSPAVGVSQQIDLNWSVKQVNKSRHCGRLIKSYLQM